MKHPSLEEIHKFNEALAESHVRSNIIGPNSLNILLGTPQGILVLFSAIFQGLTLKIQHSRDERIRKAMILLIQT